MSSGTQHGAIRPWLARETCCLTRETVIETQSLALSYRNKRVLHNINAQFAKGCITALVGPSGCGKSSFLSTLNRMSDLIPGCEVSGQIHIGGVDILRPRHDVVALRRQVGMIFQKPNPLPLSILENLTLPLRYHGVTDSQQRLALAEQALQQVGLWHEVKDRLHNAANSLSGGQQQRLCLARALVLQPEILLLDEPCSALDPIASATVEELIASLRGKYTVIIVTHNLAQARRLADDMAVFWLTDGVGSIIEQGSAAQIFDAPATQITEAYIRGVQG
jgi:phosphate transport system ATP-binding protein